MCISNKTLKKAEKEINGYKAVIKEKGKIYSLFLSVDGQTTYRGKTKFLIPTETVLLSKDFNLKTGKEKGRGFSLFPSKEEAELFIALIKEDNKTNPKDRIRSPLTAIECIIPKGSLFYKGTIKEGYIGEGIKALASQKIILKGV